MSEAKLTAEREAEIRRSVEITRRIFGRRPEGGMAAAELLVEIDRLRSAEAAARAELDKVRAEALLTALAASKSMDAAEAAARADERAACLADMERAWELRCGAYEPWPDDSDAAASHVFETLHDAVLNGERGEHIAGKGET